MNGSILFVGAGPGAPDLITCRGRTAVENADLIIYAGSLVNEELLELAPNAEKFNSAQMNFEQVIELMAKSYQDGKKVVRLHTGDPAMYGAVAEQYRELDKRGIPYEVIPGVSSVFAAAAALKTEFTMPGITQTAILTRDAGRTPVPEQEDLEKLAVHNTTMALFLSVADMDKLVAKLLKAGRAPDTPAAVVYRVTWQNEKIVRGTLENIAAKVREAGIKRQGMIIIGEVLSGSGGMSKLYDDNFAHGYRNKALYQGKCAIFALTEPGAWKAAEIAAGLGDAVIFIPEKLRGTVPEARARIYDNGGLHPAITEAWREYDGLIMIMATGIVVRSIAPLCKHKTVDPAVIVTDEQGNNVISLISGHLGGANRLAEQVAGITGGKAVITTATDNRGIMAFDELTARCGWQVVNPAMILKLSSKVLDGMKMDLNIPAEIFEQYYSGQDQFRLSDTVDSQYGIVFQAPDCLRLVAKKGVLGVGCRKGVSCETIREAVALTNWDEFREIVTLDKKLMEPGLVELAKSLNIPLRGFKAEELNTVKAPNPSPRAQAEFGVDSVAEAAVMLAAHCDTPAVEKIRHDGVTVAVGMLSDE